MLAREQIIRDEMVYDEKIKLVREAINVCYKQYHVNHAYKCRPLYVEYLAMIQHKNAIIHDYPKEIVSYSLKTMTLPSFIATICHSVDCSCMHFTYRNVSFFIFCSLHQR
jgi:hypothetical protein